MISSIIILNQALLFYKLKKQHSEKLRTLENYNNVKLYINDFYLDGDNYAQVSRFGYENFPIYMLKSIQKVYPKTYKAILKSLDKEGVDLHALISFQDKNIENIIIGQKERRDRVNSLLEEVGQVNNLNRQTIDNAYLMSSLAMDDLELQENTTPNPSLNKINHYKAVVMSFEKVKEMASKQNEKNNTKHKQNDKKNDKDSTITL